jgi:hypothetical protein
MPPPKPLDLSKGSVIHIEEFQSAGYEAKDKYLVIFGSEGLTHVLAFTLTSTDFTSHLDLAREVIEIPKGTLAKLPRRCWIKCFYEPSRLEVQRLNADYQNYKVSNKGRLNQEFLSRLRNVVECSDQLSRMDIEDCLLAMDRAAQEQKPSK